MTRRGSRWLALTAVAGAVAAGCGGSNDVVFTADRVVVYEDSAAAPSTTTPAPSGELVIERIWSPEAGIAEVTGGGAAQDDLVTVDGQPADVVSFDVVAGGSFTLRVNIVEEGAFTVCIRDECGRVFVEQPADADAG